MPLALLVISAAVSAAVSFCLTFHCHTNSSVKEFGLASVSLSIPIGLLSVAYLGGQGGHVPRAPLSGGAKKGKV